jgi:demethylmenaquinone methyltransferase/2-methoxy-6-polyprenyl-1,4-benzoquinol methylase
VSRAFLDKQPREVAAMFDGVARRYDRTNTILSFGRDRSWRQAVRRALALQPGHRTRPGVRLLAGDGLALPFADASFDAVTISFGLRNIVDTRAALAEMARVTRPGGRLVVSEFSAPVQPAFRRVYLEYLMRALPVVARRVSSNPDAYVYLAESIRAWPDQPALAAVIGESGWTQVGWRNLTGGVVALHRATRSG